MKRRNFIGLTAAFPFLASRALAFHATGRGGESNTSNIIAAVGKGENHTAMFDQLMDSLGGLGQFVKQRGTVVIKPSMAYDRKPDEDWNSNPRLAGHIIKLCYKLGARYVSLFEQTVDTWTLCYKNSGIERVAKDAGARIWPGNNNVYYQTIDGDVKIHTSLADVDLIINLAMVNSLAVKPLRGAVENYLHGILNYASLSDSRIITALKNMPKPQLTISEIRMENSNALIVSLDMVTADVVTAQLLQLPNSEISRLDNAIVAGIGNENPDEKQIVFIR